MGQNDDFTIEVLRMILNSRTLTAFNIHVLCSNLDSALSRTDFSHAFNEVELRNTPELLHEAVQVLKKYVVVHNHSHADDNDNDNEDSNILRQKSELTDEDDVDVKSVMLFFDESLTEKQSAFEKLFLRFVRNLGRALRMRVVLTGSAASATDAVAACEPDWLTSRSTHRSWLGYGECAKVIFMQPLGNDEVLGLLTQDRDQDFHDLKRNILEKARTLLMSKNNYLLRHNKESENIIVAKTYFEWFSMPCLGRVHAISPELQNLGLPACQLVARHYFNPHFVDKKDNKAHSHVTLDVEQLHTQYDVNMDRKQMLGGVGFTEITSALESYAAPSCAIHDPLLVCALSVAHLQSFQNLEQDALKTYKNFVKLTKTDRTSERFMRATLQVAANLPFAFALGKSENITIKQFLLNITTSTVGKNNLWQKIKKAENNAKKCGEKLPFEDLPKMPFLFPAQLCGKEQRDVSLDAIGKFFDGDVALFSPGGIQTAFDGVIISKSGQRMFVLKKCSDDDHSAELREKIDGREAQLASNFDMKGNGKDIIFLFSVIEDDSCYIKNQLKIERFSDMDLFSLTLLLKVMNGMTFKCVLMSMLILFCLSNRHIG